MGCRTIVIAHGKSEVIIARNLASRMRFNLEVYSNDRGERAIKLEHIERILKDPPFDSERSLRDAYPTMDFEPRKDPHMPELAIFPIIDREADDVRSGSYLSGDMFKDSPFHGRIHPILNMDTLEMVMEDCGYGPISDKVQFYQRTFSTIDVRDFYGRLRECRITNMDEFVYHCMLHSPPYQGLIETGRIEGPTGISKADFRRWNRLLESHKNI